MNDLALRFCRYAESQKVQNLIDDLLSNENPALKQQDEARSVFLANKLGRVPEAHEIYLFQQVARYLDSTEQSSKFNDVMTFLDTQCYDFVEKEIKVVMACRL